MANIADLTLAGVSADGNGGKPSAKEEKPARLNFSPAQLEKVSGFLEEMRRETGALCVLLADITGHLVEKQGTGLSLNASALSALAAGELAATKEMARLVGEETRFKLLLHEGDSQSVYLSDVESEMLLVTVFDKSTPIGIVRLWNRNVVNKLRTILEEERNADSFRDDRFADDFEQTISQELDLFFGE